MDALMRVRMTVVTAMLAVVALAAGDVFGTTVWWLLLAPLLTGVATIVTSARRWPLRFVAGVIGVVVSTSVVVLASGGDPRDIVTAVGSGPQRLLTTEWPSPDQPDLRGTVATVLAFATMLAADLARRRRLHLMPLIPVTVAQIGVIALSSPLGLRLRWVLALGALAVVLAALHPDSGVGLRDKLTLLRGERRLLPVSVTAFGLAALLALPIGLDRRADPRRDQPPDRSATLLDPVEATLALQAIDPPVDLHRIEIAGGGQPTHWRTAALTAYDGVRWSPELALRPIGRRLDTASGGVLDATVTFLDDELQLVPLPGTPVVVDAPVETDVDRTLVRLLDRPNPGQSVRISARVDPEADLADPAEVGTLEIDPNTAGLRELAESLAQEGGFEAGSDLLGELRSIETTLREDFELRADATGGGLQRALVERFLRSTQRGNAEQFSTAFALLARSLGVDTRIATGFVVDGDRSADATGATGPTGATEITLTSADAAVWPEVRVGDQWVAFDPVPPNEAADSVESPPDPQVQTPAAPQPPIEEPNESNEEPEVTETEDDDAVRAGLPVVVEWIIRGAAAAGIALAPFLLTLAMIVGAKWRRRRRWLGGEPVDRIRGAWAVVTNRLVDAGMSIAASDTNDEIAREATGHLRTCHREIRRLATLASATTFGAPARPDLLAEDAVFCLRRVEESMAGERTFRERVRWELSLRSLRRRTTSPV